MASDYDSPWKEAIGQYFPQFLQFFFPEIHDDVEWTPAMSSWASQTTNPFAWLTAAHLQAQATRRQPQKRAEIKTRLVRGLYRCGLSSARVRELFRLLDWVLALPRELEYTFKRDLARFEEENNMPYVTSIERIAREEAREEAQEEACKTLRQGILKIYQERWGQPSTQVVEKLEQIQDLKQLVDLLGHLPTAKPGQEWLA